MSAASDKLKGMSIQVNDVMVNVDLDFLIQEIPRIIKVRTRLGKGVSDKGELKPLKKLKKSYVIIRERNKSDLSSETTTGRSNLTATGQMLENIQGTRQGTRFIFTFRDKRKKSAFDNGSLTNGEVAGYVRDNGRPFFLLSESEKKGLQRRVSAILKRAVRKIVSST